MMPHRRVLTIVEDDQRKEDITSLDKNIDLRGENKTEGSF
jgi:hypothetical protein